VPEPAPVWLPAGPAKLHEKAELALAPALPTVSWALAQALARDAFQDALLSTVLGGSWGSRGLGHQKGIVSSVAVLAMVSKAEARPWWAATSAMTWRQGSNMAMATCCSTRSPFRLGRQRGHHAEADKEATAEEDKEATTQTMTKTTADEDEEATTQKLTKRPPQKEKSPPRRR
jgi:hypothetical protein